VGYEGKTRVFCVRLPARVSLLKPILRVYALLGYQFLTSKTDIEPVYQLLQLQGGT